MPSLEATVVAAFYPPPRTIAVVGLSDSPGRPSHDVAGALVRWGYRVIPVNPHIASALDRPSYPTLGDVPVPIDVVDVFRRSEHVPQHMTDILAVRPRLLWLQDGVTCAPLAEAARERGILVVQDDCLARRIAEQRSSK